MLLMLTLTESDCTVVLQQKCDNATLIIFISTTTYLLTGDIARKHRKLTVAELLTIGGRVARA